MTGTINPGPRAVDFTDGQLIPMAGSSRCDVKDAKGGAIHFEGAISDLGKYNRVVSGKWTEGGRHHDIRFVRE